MIRVLLALLLLSFEAGAATQYVCSTARGSGNGSSLANCKSAGADFSNIVVGAGDIIRICDTIRGSLTVTSTNNVAVDLDCNGEASGQIAGADVVTSFLAADANGEYVTAGTFSVPMFVLVDGVAWKEGVKGALAKNEWAFNSTAGGTQAVYLGSNPAGRVVEIATRGFGVAFVSSTGGTVSGGRIYGIRHTGTGSPGNAAVVFNGSSGAVNGTDFYAVMKSADARAGSTVTMAGTNTSYCGDGLDANKSVSLPTVIMTDNVITDCDYGGWFTNTRTSHAFTLDGEAIACTNCASITATGNTIERVNKAITTIIDSAAPQIFDRNWIKSTTDDGINASCTNSSGVMNVRAVSNIMRDIGDDSGWSVNAYGAHIRTTGCAASGHVVDVSGNTLVNVSQGFLFGADAAQTGTWNHINNAIINVDPGNVTGTHYFVNWANVSATHALTIKSNNNGYYQTIGDGAFRWVSGSAARTYANYTLYLTDSSQDANSIRIDPAFVDGISPTAENGFKLRSNSPLIRAGTCYLSTGCAPPDFGGRRVRVPPDIGAWQRRAGD